MERFTKRDEYGNAEIIGVDSDLQLELGFAEFYTVTEALNKLAEYEDLEEQDLLLKLPCKIGDDVYFIPSKTNYRLNIANRYEMNNRVYHQKVSRITFTERGWYLECDKDLEFGIAHILVDIAFKETWFLSQEEAEQALAKIEERQSKWKD